ncbi:MAG: SRPBCC domain-containing protein [Myxococcota bacterium]
MLYRAEATIAAPAAHVWAVLTEFDAYGAWNPFTPVVRLGGPLAIGTKVSMRVRIYGFAQPQSERISALEPGRLLAWGFGGPFVRADRRQTVEDLGEGTSRYVTEDRIEGPLAGVVEALLGNRLRAGFQGVAEGLKARAEATC